MTHEIVEFPRLAAEATYHAATTALLAEAAIVHGKMAELAGLVDEAMAAEPDPTIPEMRWRLEAEEIDLRVDELREITGWIDPSFAVHGVINDAAGVAVDLRRRADEGEGRRLHGDDHAGDDNDRRETELEGRNL